MLNSSANLSLPRTLPKKLVLSVFFTQGQIIVALVLTLVTGVIATIFIPNTDTSFFTFKGNEPVAQGIIQSVSQTNSSENKRSIYCYSFRYQTPDGKNFTNESYLAGGPEIASGDTVPVEYIVSDPANARIRGMRNKPFGRFIFFFAIEPILAIIFLLIGIRKARKNIHLMKNGMLTSGQVTQMVATNTKINNNRVYKVFFRYSVNGSEYTSHVRTHKTIALKNEKQEPLLYDSAKPENAVLLDALPKSVRKFFEEGL